MKKLLITIVVIALAVFAAITLQSESGNSSSGSSSSSNSSNNSASKIIDESKAEAAKASELGFLWTEVDELIKKAEKSLAEGKDEDAIKWATKAKNQAIAGQQQAKDQANAGPRF